MPKPVIRSIDTTRRIASRYAFERRIRIHLQRGSQTLKVGGWTRDISESGLGAFVAQGLVPGEEVILEIPLSHSSKQTIPAIVSRAVGTQYGFQFTALTSEQRAGIQAVTEDKAPIS